MPYIVLDLCCLWLTYYVLLVVWTIHVANDDACLQSQRPVSGCCYLVRGVCVCVYVCK